MKSFAIDAKEKLPLLNHDLDKKPKETPLPWAKIAVVGMILFANTLSVSIIFPFLPFMTKDFFPELEQREVGFKAGYLGSCFALGGFLASYIWGDLADRIGRRPVMIAGLVGTIISMFLFGCSQSFTWAMGARFLWGLLNGNIGVAKTYLSDILDETNTSRGFAVIGFQSGMGRLVGPALGGVLSRPADKWAMFNNTFWRKCPYLLPCLVAAVFATTTLIGTICYLEETLNQPQQLDYEEIKDKVEVGVEIDDALDAPLVTRASKARKSYHREYSNHSDIFESQYGEEIQKGAQGGQSSPSSESMLQLFSIRKVYVTSLTFMLLSGLSILTTEGFPLWALNSPEDGGFNFTTQEIGMTYTYSAPFEILFQVYLYPSIANQLGFLRTFEACATLFGGLVFLLPFTSMISLVTTSVLLKYLVLIPVFACMVSMRMCAFTSLFVLINNSVTSARRGRVNGLAQSLCSVAQIIAPSFTSIGIAWSENNTHSGVSFPFNFHFVWIVGAILCFLSAYVARKFLTEEINHPPAEDDH